MTRGSYSDISAELKSGPQNKATEYTAGEMKRFLEEMAEEYDLARVVDPIEGRILDIQEDGRINRDESCYCIWNAEQKCINCSSSIACRTGRPQEKTEHFQDKVFYIQSDPVELKLPDGSTYEAILERVNVEEDGGRPVADANDREAENIDATATRYQAHHDSLTNVLNAEAFYELSRETIKNSSNRDWVMITGNIMDFRLVNALFGVEKGNEVLVRTASLLREIAEGAGGLSGRLGGDQFALLLPHSMFSEDVLCDAARTLEQHFSNGIYTIHIHFGVYRIDDASMPVSVMCGRANSALRTIREDMTRTVAHFDDGILEKILLAQKVVSGFEEALREGQFRLHLQPMVDQNGRTIGAEALARWCRPDGTVMMPEDFIETLENAGLIQQLDVYIWEQAARLLSSWKGTDKQDLSISVNMSAKDFYSIDVYDVLMKLVRRYGIESSKLRLEITETALLVEPEKSDAVISALRGEGFLVEIDDFGKGYSSLSLLKSIQADVLKIDMSFLREIRYEERSRIIMKAVISLANALDMEVITEGVETEEQLRTLSAMGCNHFQGYFFSRPMPAEEFEKRTISGEALG